MVRRRVRGRWFVRLFGLDAGVPGWDGQAEDVGEGARVAVGDLACQGGDLRGEDRLRRGHPLQEGEAAFVVALVDAFEQEAVHELSGEPNPTRQPGTALRVQRRRDEVVERAVQVRQRHVDGHPRHGQRLGGPPPALLGGPLPALRALWGARPRRDGRPPGRSPIPGSTPASTPSVTFPSYQTARLQRSPAPQPTGLARLPKRQAPSPDRRTRNALGGSSSCSGEWEMVCGYVRREGV